MGEWENGRWGKTPQQTLFLSFLNHTAIFPIVLSVPLTIGPYLADDGKQCWRVVPDTGEQFLQLIGGRRNQRAVSYLLSKVTSKYPVVRAAIVRSLTCIGLADPRNAEVIVKVAPLLSDSDPDVASQSFVPLSYEVATASSISDESVRSLVDARNSAKVGTKVLDGIYDLRGRLDRALSDCELRLELRRETATGEEREAIDRALRLIKQSAKPKTEPAEQDGSVHKDGPAADDVVKPQPIADPKTETSTPPK